MEKKLLSPLAKNIRKKYTLHKKVTDEEKNKEHREVWETMQVMLHEYVEHLSYAIPQKAKKISDEKLIHIKFKANLFVPIKDCINILSAYLYFRLYEKKHWNNITIKECIETAQNYCETLENESGKRSGEAFKAIWFWTNPINSTERKKIEGIHFENEKTSSKEKRETHPIFG